MNIRSLMPFVFHVFYKKVRHEHPAKAQWNKNIRSETACLLQSGCHLCCLTTDELFQEQKRSIFFFRRKNKCVIVTELLSARKYQALRLLKLFFNTQGVSVISGMSFFSFSAKRTIFGRRTLENKTVSFAQSVHYKITE